MSAADTIKDIVRIITNAGLPKDVIDSLQIKTNVLGQQIAKLEMDKEAFVTANAVLSTENRFLRLEYEKIETQLQNAQPKGDRVNETTETLLKYIFDKGADFSDQEISRHFQMKPSVAAYHTDILFKNKFIRGTLVGIMGSPSTMGITERGRRYVMEHGLANRPRRLNFKS